MKKLLLSVVCAGALLALPGCRDRCCDPCDPCAKREVCDDRCDRCHERDCCCEKKCDRCDTCGKDECCCEPVKHAKASYASEPSGVHYERCEPHRVDPRYVSEGHEDGAAKHAQ